MKNKLIALFTVVLMLFQIVAPVMAMELQDDKVETKLTPTYTPSISYILEGKYYSQLCNVSLTGNQRTDLIAVAQSQYGYHEGGSINDLGGGSSSSGNYTEYGFWYGINPGAWCAMFVSWCARQAQIPTSVLKNSACAGCSASYFNIPYYNGSSYTPQPGDLFFTKSWSHVGIVASVSGSSFTTIEGNSSDKVTSHTYSISNYYFGVWSDSEPNVNVPDHTLYTQPTRDLYYGCKGDDVKWLQAALWEVGYPENTYGIDGDFGQLTKNKVIQFQKDNGLTADGIFGTASRNKMIELFTPYPANAWVNASPGTIMLGQSVHITCGADYAEWYYTTIYFNGSNVYNCDTNDYYYTPTEAGTYEVHASGQNGRGGSDVARCEFTVLDTTITKPIISTSQNKYAYNSEVEINWTVDSNVSWYWINIYEGSNLAVSVNPGYSGTYMYKAETPGQVAVKLSAHNDYNDVDADDYYFMVLPETPVLNVNPGTDKTNTAFYWNRCVGAESYDLRIFNADGSSYLNWWSISDNCKLINLPAGSYYATVTAGNGLEGCWAFSSQTEVFTVDSLCNVRMIDSVEYDGHTYALLNHKVPDWHDAEMICEKLGGHLATITSEDEQEVIFNLIKECGDHVWLGASDEEEEGTWKWVTGEDFSYTNWNEDQPDNHNSDTLAGEDYMHMYSTNGKWNDITNVGYCPYILIELEYNGETYDGLPIASTEYNGHTYTLYSDIVLNWHDAEEFCESNGGTLATITSEEEQQVVFELVADNFDFGTLWLGATDEESEGNWEWVTGEPFDYTNWDEGEPSNSNEREHYMHLYINYGDYTGKWNDTIEIQPCYFILETVNTYTVTYLDGITDEVISTATVEHGADADFPTSPEHEGYTFTGWDSDGKNITADMTITALYEESSSVILGDANGDGVINGKDVTLIRRYITGGYDVEVILEAADINGDGVINGKDITLLRRLIVGGYGDVA